jgi:polyisoprenoid-binding protein YceI
VEQQQGRTATVAIVAIATLCRAISSALQGNFKIARAHLQRNFKISRAYFQNFNILARKFPIRLTIYG